MKTRTTTLALATAALFIVVSCQPKKTSEQKSAVVKSETAAEVITKEKIRDIRKGLPPVKEVVNLINTSGAPYLAGMTVEDMDPGTLLTRTEKAKAMGYVSFDLLYTKTYNQLESFNKLLTLYETLAKELGFEELMQSMKQFKTDYEQKKGNKAEVDALVDDMLVKVRKLMYNAGSAKDLSMVFVGSVAKSLNIISYQILFAPQSKDGLMAVLQQQKTAVDGVCQVLAGTPGDSDLARYLEMLTPLNKIFQSTEPFNNLTIEQINKLSEAIIK